ncbi:MAG: hypothetical protein KDB00_00990 [Planctomycetales bacterium]|nr:hypothetical protein [Planctomycetales bacterium]
MSVDAEHAVKTMILKKLGKFFVQPQSAPSRFAQTKLTLGREWIAAGGIAAMVALASAGDYQSATAADPILDDVPSYILNPPVSIAALVQGEQVQSEKAGKPETDSEKTLRNALEILDEKKSSLDSDLAFPNDAQGNSTDQVANRSIFADRKTSLQQGRFVLPPIEALTTSTSAVGNGEVPLGFRDGNASPMVSLPESGIQRGLPWQWNEYRWAAANTFSHPLYFEDRMLERHGHQRYPHLQPLVSAGRFAAQAFMLPYQAAINPPCECQYSLGYYRAGSCAPALLQRPPYQRKAAAAQAAGIVKAVIIIP